MSINQQMIPKDGINPYANHPGFDGQGCTLQYTVTQRGAYGDVRGGFGCHMTGGHCLPGDQCEQHRNRAQEEDKMAEMCREAKETSPILHMPSKRI